MLTKWSFYQTFITAMKIYAPNNRTLKIMKQNLTKLYKETVIVGDLKTTLQILGRTQL